MDKSEFLPEYIKFADSLEGVDLKVRNGYFFINDGKMSYENSIEILDENVDIQKILDEILLIAIKYDTPILLIGDVNYKTIF